MVICQLGSICRHGHQANINLPACRRSYSYTHEDFLSPRLKSLGTNVASVKLLLISFFFSMASLIHVD